MARLALLGAASALCAAASPADSLVTPRGAIALPGVTDAAGSGKLDHSAFLGGLLFLAVKENDTLAVLDTDAGAFVTSLAVASPQGVATSAALSRVFVASSAAGTLTAFSAAPPFALAWTAVVGGDADNVRLDEGAGLVWVAHGGGAAGPGALAAVNATSGALVADVPVSALHPEELNLSPLSSLITVSVPAPLAGGGEIVLVDRAARAPLPSVWAAPPGGAWANPSAQHVDATGTRLWVATAGDAAAGIPAKVVVLNALDGALLWSFESGAGCDDVQTDGTARVGTLAFAACGGPASRLWVARATRVSARGAPDAWELLGNVTSLPAGLANARGLAWRAKARRLFVPVPLVAAAAQAARVLVFDVAPSVGGGGGGGGGYDDDSDDGEGAEDPDDLPLKTWVLIVAGAAVAALGVGVLAARRFCPGKARAAPAGLGALAFGETEEDAYNGLN